MTSREELLAKALTDILDANDEFRKGMPDDWDGDPLQDACAAARKALGTPAQEASIVPEAKFLLDRLQEFDPGDFDAERDFHGHVAPAIARLRNALYALPSTGLPAPAPHAEVRESEWRPIDTKPKDHFPVLVWGPFGHRVAFEDVTWTWFEAGAEEPMDDWKPSHWMPLPRRPSTQSGGGK